MSSTVPSSPSAPAPSDASSTVRVRFAPSPTGMMHVGNARAALFNWLFARSTGGKFLVRVEDTDLERSTPEAIAHIFESLAWLGMEPDEPPVYQTHRLARHREAIQALLAEGKLYVDHTPKARLEELRTAAQTEKRAFVFRRALLEPDEDERHAAAGEPGVIRFAVPDDGVTVLDDAVYGRIEFANSTLGDFVVARGDGSPLFVFSNAVDDLDMGITHVIRGEDHVPNTPKQILVYQALGATPPKFGHLPMILGPDRQKLSKRHGAVRVMQFAEDGMLPAALINFLALLGWSPDGAEHDETMTVDEIVSAFTLDKVNKSGAVFDYTKLAWMNGMHIRRLPTDVLHAKVLPLMAAAYPAGPPEPPARTPALTADAWTKAIIDLEMERSRALADFAPALSYFYHAPAGPDAYEAKGMAKFLTTPEQKALLTEVRGVIEAAWHEAVGPDGAAAPVPTPDLAKALEAPVRAWSEARGVKLGPALQPVRLALTGRTASPPLFDIILLLGLPETLRRIDAVLEIQPA